MLRVLGWCFGLLHARVITGWCVGVALSFLHFGKFLIRLLFDPSGSALLDAAGTDGVDAAAGAAVAAGAIRT